MFPLNSNLPYIKDDGTRDKLGNVIGSGGGGGGGSDIPEHTIADAGKVLGVDDEGNLAWMKIANTFEVSTTNISMLYPISSIEEVE